jgi:YihY family inner membrane protein
MASLADARRVLDETRDRDVSTAAASVAYYALVSLVPTLALATVAAGVVGGPALEATVLAFAQQYLLPSGQELVLSALRNTAGRSSATVLSLLVLVWSALKLFRGLDAAFARVYGTDPGGLVDRLRGGAVAGLAVGGGVFVAAVAASVAATLVTRIPVLGVFAPLLLLVPLVGALFPLYYVLPDVHVAPREALPGTVLAAGGWTVLGAAFGLYAAAATAGSYALYGVLGAVLLLATWLYLAASLLLVGAVVNAVLAGVAADEPTDRQVQQSGGRASETTMDEDGREPEGAPDIEDLADRLDAVREDLDEFEADVRDRTVDKPSLEAELKRYVRRRVRRGHARGWGPYLVLLYGTAMTIAAFVLLSDVLAVIAMVVIFLSTLGLYVLFVLAGVSLNLIGSPRRLYDAVRERRE